MRYDAQKRLIENSQLEDGKMMFSKQYVYQDSTLFQYIEIEHKVNGEVWKTVIEDNDKGNPANKKLFKGDKLWQEDQYIYEYHK